MKNVGVVEPGRNARRMLDLEEPYLDWTHLARGMGVEAVSVDTAVSYTHLDVYKRQVLRTLRRCLAAGLLGCGFLASAMDLSPP